MSTPLHRICIAGASGRMGRILIETIQNADDCALGGALDMTTSPALRQDPVRDFLIYFFIPII